MKCKNCGKEVKEGSVFCASCGSRLLVEGLRSKHEIEQTRAPLDTRAEVLKPKKKSGGCLGCLGIFLLIIIGIVGIIKLVSWYREYSYNKLVEESLLVDKSKVPELNKGEKKQDWNNDGLSNEEAERKGLNITVLDSDGDGLSDTDEINVYKSNPLKYSTKGDIYSDGDKVALGYDVNKKYETFTIKETTNPKIKVEIDNAYDMRFYYKEYKGLVPDGYYLGFQPFRLFSFTGEINVEMDKPENYQVISYDLITDKVKNINCKIENNNLVFNVSDDNPILIFYKDSIVKKMNDTALADINSKFTNDVKKEYFVVAFPIITVLFDHPVYVLEIDNRITEGGSDEAFAKEINSKLDGQFRVEHYYTNEKGIQILQKMLGQLSNEIYSNVGEENRSFIDWVVSYKRVTGKKELSEYLIGEFGEEKEEQVPEEVVENPFEEKYTNMSCVYCGDSNFKVNVNAFPFQNLSTKKSSGGVCAGFSYVTTNIYNNGGLPKNVEKVYTMDSANYTNIWNKNLYSYKPSDKELIKYADDKRENEEKLDSSQMSSPDNEVVKALEYYWDESNKDIRMKKFGWAWNSSFEKRSYIDEATINKVVKQFKEGKIVSVMLLSSSGQHAINAYKITEDKNDPDILYLKAYDNNFPDDMFWNADSGKKVKYDVSITVKRVYENTLFGVKQKYTYSYDPINSDAYIYESMGKTYDGILFLDENNDVL